MIFVQLRILERLLLALETHLSFWTTVDFLIDVVSKYTQRKVFVGLSFWIIVHFPWTHRQMFPLVDVLLQELGAFGLVPRCWLTHVSAQQQHNLLVVSIVSGISCHSHVLLTPTYLGFPHAENASAKTKEATDYIKRLKFVEMYWVK